MYNKIFRIVCPNLMIYHNWINNITISHINYRSTPGVVIYQRLCCVCTGKPGTDYPVLAVVPYTDFYCDDQPYPGFFADMDTRCQAWHYCDIDGRQASFLCPNGTQFSQAVFVCDWWFNVRCDLSKELYHINERLYRTTPRPDRPHRVLTKELLDQIFLWPQNARTTTSNDEKIYIYKYYKYSYTVYIITHNILLSYTCDENRPRQTP